MIGNIKIYNKMNKKIKNLLDLANNCVYNIYEQRFEKNYRIMSGGFYNDFNSTY